MKYILASGREINLNVKDKEGKTVIDAAREGNCIESDREIVKDTERKEIIELMESFERNSDETRVKLRIQLGLAGNIYLFSFFFFFLTKKYFFLLLFLKRN